MGGTRSIARRAAPAALLFVLASGCQLAPAKVWNLEQLHAPDGSPRRAGRLKSDLAYLVTQSLVKTGFGGAELQAQQTSEKRIDDPLGACLENVLELARCRRDEKVAALQAAAFGWLAVDCTYALSRERCALELGELAQALRLSEAPPAPLGEPSTAESVKSAFDELVATVREVEAAPALAGDSLTRVCDRIHALSLDRPGALRLLRATSALLVDGERGAVFAPLRALRLDLARRCTTLALRSALEDSHGRVRAAALEASMRAFPAERAQRLRWAMLEPMEEVEAREEVSLRALELVARYGLPPPSEGEDPADLEREWRGLLARELRLQVDGPHTTAACRALARITGEPVTLRPEVWLARASAAGAERDESVPGGPGTNP